MEATDVLELDTEILRCAVLDDAGRITSYAESERGKVAKLPANFSLNVKALVIQSLSQAFPKELGEVKYTTIVTDAYRLVTTQLAGQVVMFALPREVNPDTICDAAIKRFGKVSAVNVASKAARS
jgi:hypothetical protein